MCFGSSGFGLGCGLPLEHMFAGYQGAAQRTNDCIEREKHVVRQEGEVEDGEAEGGCEGLEAFACADEAEFQQSAAEVEAQLNKDGEEEKHEAGDGPVERAAGEDEPAEEKEKEGDGFDEAAAEVVEDLPARDGVDGIGNELAGLVGDTG